MSESIKRANFVDRQVQSVVALLDAYEECLTLRLQWDALNYGTEISQGDLQGSLDYLTPQELADAFTSIDAIKAVMDAGHKTNLYKLVP